MRWLLDTYQGYCYVTSCGALGAHVFQFGCDSLSVSIVQFELLVIWVMRMYFSLFIFHFHCR